MKPIALATALALTLAAAPAAAQARVNVWFGVGAPAPYESGVVVVRPRFPYYRDRGYYRTRERYFDYDAPRGVRRGYWMRQRYRWHRWHRDDDDDRD